MPKHQKLPKKGKKKAGKPVRKEQRARKFAAKPAKFGKKTEAKKDGKAKKKQHRRPEQPTLPVQDRQIKPVPPATVSALSAPAAPIRVPLVAVIDVGSTAIRMMIAQPADDGEFHILESLQHPVRLGKDTFTKGRIEGPTIEESVRILKGFKQTLAEYGVPAEEVRAVATSSVREAINRDTFLDRVYIATGIQVEAIEEAEESRLTYLAARHLLPDKSSWDHGHAMIVEVGGGNTDLLLLHDGHVSFSNMYRLGSLRMRETLEASKVPVDRQRKLLEQHIRTNVDVIRRSVPIAQVDTLIAVSGDMRFASSRLKTDPDPSGFFTLTPKAFNSFAEKLALVPVEELVRREHLTYQEAETIGPALMTYRQIAKAFSVKSILVSPTSMREGLLQEMAARGAWSRDFAEQAIHSALSLGVKYQFDERHARHVADLSIKLFRFLREEHRLGQRYEALLHLAALLHDLGMFVSSRQHHKHSMYLILNSDLFGLTIIDKILISLVARYHRRATPSAEHQEYAVLTRDNRMAVAKLASILRVADALDRNHLQNAREVELRREDGQLSIGIPDLEDLTLERQAIKEKGSMFEEVYGLKVVLRRA